MLRIARIIAYRGADRTCWADAPACRAMLQGAAQMLQGAGCTLHGALRSFNVLSHVAQSAELNAGACLAARWSVSSQHPAAKLRARCGHAVQCARGVSGFGDDSTAARGAQSPDR